MLTLSLDISLLLTEEDWSIQSKCWQGFPVSKLVSKNSLPFSLASLHAHSAMKFVSKTLFNLTVFVPIEETEMGFECTVAAF